MSRTLVIADDHEILRDALARYAAASRGFEVVASVADARSAVNACARHQPLLLLLDIEMPGRDALSAIKDVQAVSPRTKVIVLTAYCRDSFIQLAMQSGVAGYLLKSDPPVSIFEALDRIAAGEIVLSRAVRARIPDAAANIEPKAPARPLGLTPRELEVLRGIARGYDNERMAQEMCLSKRTVERHVARLMDAVGIRDRAGLVKCAYEHGLVV